MKHYNIFSYSKLVLSFENWTQYRKNSMVFLCAVFLFLAGAVQPVYGIAILLFILLAIIYWNIPIVALYVLIFSIPLTSATQRGGIVPTLRLNEIIFLFTIVFFLIRGNLFEALSQSLRTTIGKAYTWGIIFPQVFIPISFWLVGSEILNIRDIIHILAPIQYFFLFSLISRTKVTSQKQTILNIMILVGFIAAIIGILQTMFSEIGVILYKLYPTVQSERAVSGVRRITSTLGGWNDAGAFFSTNGILLFCLISVTKNKCSPYIFTITVFIVNFVALLLSGNFASTISFFLGVLICSCMNHNLKTFVKIVLAATVIVFIMSFTDFISIFEDRIHHQFQMRNSLLPTSLLDRFKIWEWTIEFSQRDIISLLFGSGPTPSYIYETYGGRMDSELLSYFRWRIVKTGFSSEEGYYSALLLRYGISSIFLFFFFLFATLKTLLKKYKTCNFGDLQSSICLTSLILLIVMSVAGLSNAYLLYSGSAEWLWILLGISASESEF